MRTLTITIAALLTLTACSQGKTTPPSPSATITIAGDVQGSSIGSGNNVAGHACVPYGSWNSGVRSGAQVTITDEAAKVVGLGRLQAGVATARFECLMHFSVPGVPAGRPFYGVQVAGGLVVRFTAAQIGSQVKVILRS